MEKKFKETSIPEDYSKALVEQGLLVGPSHVYRIAIVLFHGVSSCLGAMKNPSVPKAIVFRSLDHSFLAGAKVEYIKNEDDPTNPASGRWDYTWTFYEDDLKGADCIEAVSNSLVASYFVASGLQLYNMRFNDAETSIVLVTFMLEMIIAWLKENVSETEDATLTLDGVFKATSTMDKGKVEMGIVPDGEMKVLIKDDSAIQEK